MGGMGSGWNRGGSRYLTVEQCYDLDIADLARVGFFSQPGYKATAPWTWTTSGGHRDGEKTTVQVEIDLTAGQTPSYAVFYGAKHDTGETALGIRGELLTTVPRYGGVRYWFRCERCWRRVRVLYAYPSRGRERFNCRRCQGLRYYAHTESQPDRLIRKARKYWRRAGSTDHTEPWQKPKWMRWATFSRLVLAGREAQDTADWMMFASLSAGLARIEAGRTRRRGR